MRELVDVDYPDAPIIRVVMDNLVWGFGCQAR
jgi:hypothetical protein